MSELHVSNLLKALNRERARSERLREALDRAAQLLEDGVTGTELELLVTEAIAADEPPPWCGETVGGIPCLVEAFNWNVERQIHLCEDHTPPDHDERMRRLLLDHVAGQLDDPEFRRTLRGDS